MVDNLTFGFSDAEISLISSLGQIILSLVALILTIINLKILRRLNIVDSMRRVNDKFSELNNLEIVNENLIKLNPLNYTDEDSLSKSEVRKIKENNIIFNYLNILESVYLEMNYKTLKKKHAMKIMDSFIPDLMNNKRAKKLLINSGYDNNFINFCLNYNK